MQSLQPVPLVLHTCRILRMEELQLKYPVSGLEGCDYIDANGGISLCPVYEVVLYELGSRPVSFSQMVSNDPTGSSGDTVPAPEASERKRE